MVRGHRRAAQPQDVVAGLRRLDASLDLLDERVAASLGIGRTDLRGMEIVSRGGGVPPTQLARELRLTTGSVTALIDRLEAAGLIRRADDPADRRKVLVQLTTAGREREKIHFAPLAREMLRALDQYSDAELWLVADFL